MNVNASTPTAEVLSSRPALIRLAQEVFGRSAPSQVRAFGQFAKSVDLAKVIDAKRAGVFDYGACIIDTDTGAQWPTNVEKVLAAIDKAQNGTLEVDDVAAMFTNVTDPEKRAAAINAVLTRIGISGQAQAESEPEPVVEETAQVVEPDPTPLAPKSNVLPFKSRPQVVEPEPETEAADSVVQPAIPTHILDPIKEQLDLIGKGLAQHYESTEIGFKAHARQHAETWSALVVLNETLLHVNENIKRLNANLKLVSEYFDPGIEFQEIADVGAPIPEALGAVAVAQPETRQDSRVESPRAEERSADPVDEDAAASGGEEVDITRESLEKLELTDLRELAQRLGIKGGGNIGYKEVAIKKILRAAGVAEE